MDVRDLEVELIKATVEFGLYESAMKGRHGYKSGVRPNHWIPGRDYVFSGQLDFRNRKELSPGQTCTAIGTFSVVTQDVKDFLPGFTWHVCEGSSIVGFARIKRVRSHKQKDASEAGTSD